MLRRTLTRLTGPTATTAAAAAATAAVTPPSAHSHVNAVFEATAKKGIDMAHQRSSFTYGADKTEGGARSDTAFIAFSPSECLTLSQKYGMPHVVNLLTALPLRNATFFVQCIGLGIVVAYVVGSANYEFVEIPRPPVS